jgi:hypothetical protein
MSTPKRIILWTLALLPFGAAVLAHQRGNSPTLAIAQRTLPALAFDQYLVDLGPVQPSAEVRANFVFRHRGSQPVKILELTPSCGCLQPRLRKMDYDPGDVDALVLRVQPANEAPGKHEYTVDIKYLDPEPRQTRVTFRVQLPEKGISVTPPAVMVYQFSERETVVPIRITDTRGESWSVLGVSVTLPYVNVAAGDPVRSEDGVFEQPLQVSVAAKVPAGRHRGLITVYTDNQQYPELKIPLMIQGPEGGIGDDSTEEHLSP